MSSLQTGTAWTEAINAKIKSKRTIGYFRANAASELYEYILEKFLAYQKRTKITKAQFAESIQKDAGQLNRLLAGPGNWTIETVSDLLLGMGERIKPASEAIIGINENALDEPLTDAIACNANESSLGKKMHKIGSGLANGPTASNDNQYTKQDGHSLPDRQDELRSLMG